MTTISQAARDAAKSIDWQQIAMNGGPACFHIHADGHFCGRAQRWDGHHHDACHVFVSLDDFLESVLASETAPLRQQLEEAEHRHCLRTADAIAEKQAKEAAIARVAELEAQCAAIVGLIKNAEPLCNIGRVRLQSYGEQLPELNRCLELLEMAMSSTAGASLLAHVKELDKDKARLDWLDDHQVTDIYYDGNGSDDSEGVITCHSRPGVREALSAAMAKDQEQDAGGER